MILKQFFTAISYIFHPILMPFLGIYLLLLTPTKPITLNRADALFFFPYEIKKYLFIVLGILTILAPLLSLFIMRKNRIISSYTLENREERMYPYGLFIFYYILAYFFVRRQIPLDFQHDGLVGFLFGILLAVIIAFVFNFFTKISLHALAINGVCGMLLAYSQSQLPIKGEVWPTNLYLILYLIVIAGIVMSARLYLKAHRLSELLLGAGIGFAATYCCIRFAIYI